MILSFSAVAKGKEPYQLKREITLRWGMDDFSSDGIFFGHTWLETDKTPLERYNSGKYYYDGKVSTRAVSLSCSQEIKRWFSLSLNASYSAVSQNERQVETNQVSNTYRKYRLSIYPMVRFTYFNRPAIRLYSAAGFGLSVMNEKWSSNRQYHNSETDLGGQITFFGVSVGKDLFASWEAGIGNMGFIVIGGGYRF